MGPLVVLAAAVLFVFEQVRDHGAARDAQHARIERLADLQAQVLAPCACGSTDRGNP